MNNMIIKCQLFICILHFLYLKKSILFIFEDNREVVVAIKDIAVVVELKVPNQPVTLKQIFCAKIVKFVLERWKEN
jgi:hypothetical protein